MRAALQERLHYRFRDESLLVQALTHPSAGGAGPNNQRFEFLGDAVLGLLIAELLLERFPAEREGEITRRHAALVGGPALDLVARELALGNLLILSKGEEEGGGRATPSNLEDACEAVVAAIYLDGGLEAARQFVRRFWEPLLSSQLTPPKDAKTTLQEWSQQRGLGTPTYETVEARGPSHAPEFEVRVAIEGKGEAMACGASKKAAEQQAARLLLEQLSQGMR